MFRTCYEGQLEFSVEALLQRDESLGGGDARDMLDAVVEQLHQMGGVLHIDLYQHGVGACGEVALYHFREILELAESLTIHGALLEADADVGAGVVAQRAGVDFISGADDNFQLDEALDALVDSRTRHAASSCETLTSFRRRYRGP